MELREFCQDIGLSQGAQEALFKREWKEEEYQAEKRVFQKDKPEFYDLVKTHEDYRLRFLYDYCRMGCEAWETYKEKGISREIFLDTFRDLACWCENCWHEYGEYGINEYHWFYRHIELTVFRLGRLQFEKTPSQWEFTLDGKEIKKGDTVISIHIPQGERLDREKCLASCRLAFAFWGTEHPYVCYSWLLDENLSKILLPGSNILEFQKLFTHIRTEVVDRYGEWRIFSKLLDNPADYPEDTSLRRAVKKYLLEGKRIGEGLGVLNLYRELS